MMCYMISQGGEPVAVVASIDIARAIVHCQPWGEYLVEPMEVEEPASDRRPRPPLRHRFTRARHRAQGPPPRWSPGLSAAPIDRAVPQAR